MFKRIANELTEHIPFTIAGAVSGIIAMVFITIFNTPKDVSEVLFYTFHPLHIVFSSLVTTAMYRKTKKGRFWLAIIIGYVGSVGIATISDAVVPYLGGSTLNVAMEFHLPFLETQIMPYIGVPEWIIVNAAAFIGICIGYFRPNTKLPHLGHVLLSTWASLFGFTAFGIANWIPLLPFIFVFLFLSVWVPCCVSDVVFPLLWTGEIHSHHSHH